MKTPKAEQMCNKISEGAVLGSMLLNPKCISQVLGRIDENGFFLPEHKVIFVAIRHLYITGKPTGADCVAIRLGETGELDKGSDIVRMGGVRYLQRVMETVTSAADVVYHVGKLQAKQRERELICAVEKIETIAYNSGDIADRIGEITQCVWQLQDVKSESDYVVVPEVVTKVAGDIQNQKLGLIPSGFRDLDPMIAGFAPSELTIIAGRPSMGKTSLMLQIAMNTAKSGIGVLVCSLEMSGESLIQRGICNLAALSLKDAKTGNLEDSDWSIFYGKALQIAEQKWPIIITNVADTPEKLTVILRQVKAAYGVKLVMVDYMQQMKPGTKTENRQQQIAEVARKLKRLAMQENVAVVAMSQLNRRVEERQNHRPMLSDLRESGDIEQEADLVMLIYRADYYKQKEFGIDLDGETELIIAKSRNGPTGVVKLVFLDTAMQFGDLSRE